MNNDIVRLESLQDTSRPTRRRKLLGRGPGSRKGKTCCRGVKGMGARSGYKIRAGKEGGGVPLYRRMPTRGFSHERFAKRLDVINLDRIEIIYSDKEVVSIETLRQKGYIRGHSHGIKVLGKGTLTKKVTFNVDAISSSAKEKIEAAGIKL